MELILQEPDISVSDTLVLIKGHTFSTPNITSMRVDGPSLGARIFQGLLFFWLMYLAGWDHPVLAFICFVLAVSLAFRANTLVLVTAGGEVKALHAFPFRCRRIQVAIFKAMQMAVEQRVVSRAS